GLVPGLAVRPPHLQLVNPARGVPEAVRPRRLGEVVELRGIGVEAALVRPDARRQQQALLIRQELFLREEAEILDLRALLGDLDIGPGADDFLARRQVAARDAR